MDSSNPISDYSFIDLILKTLKERKDLIGHDSGTDSLVKLLVEIRESARRNEAYDIYERISDDFEKELGLVLREETRIIATRK